MYFFCPRCNASFYNKDYDICPECGFNIKRYKKSDYITKLIKSLNHRSGEIKNFSINILAEKKVKKAIPYLKKIIKKTNDPLLKINAINAIKKINS